LLDSKEGFFLGCFEMLLLLNSENLALIATGDPMSFFNSDSSSSSEPPLKRAKISDFSSAFLRLFEIDFWDKYDCSNE